MTCSCSSIKWELIYPRTTKLTAGLHELVRVALFFFSRSRHPAFRAFLGFLDLPRTSKSVAVTLLANVNELQSGTCSARKLLEFTQLFNSAWDANG